MPRREKPLESGDDPLLQFAADLRRLRQGAGSPTYRTLAERAHYSVATLAAAASGQRLPSLSVTLAFVRVCDGDVGEWEKRWHEVAVQRRGEESSGRVEGDICPYMGLAAFEADDSEWFFGRERAVEDLTSRLERHRVVALFGASGSGKSSVLRAGVAPAVENVVVFTPGARPLEECAIAIARGIGSTPERLHADLMGGPRALYRALRQTSRRVTLIVDQFEEVFTLCREESERDLFLAQLLTAAGEEAESCRVLLGVRADFYAHCTRYPDLVEALRDSQVMLGPMTAEELGQAITKPAVRAGCTVEGGLLAALVADTVGQPGVLPLLSHALRETWLRRRGMTLPLDGFRAAGGIDGALARTAEDFYSGLPPGRRELVRDLFLRMIAPGEGTEDTKRRIEPGELDADPDTREVLELLVTARLLTLGDGSVEIAHEAIIRSWPRLHDWLSTHRDGLRVHRQLTDATAVWEVLGRDAGSLYRGTRLALARDWALTAPSALSQRERVFLDASIAAEEKEHASAQRRTRLLWQLVTLLTVLVLVATSTTVFAIRAGRIVTEQRNESLSREVAAQASALRELNPALSLQLSLAAYRLAPTVEARGQLLSTFAAPYSTRLSGRAPSIANNPYGRTGVLAPDGGGLATAEGDFTVRLWDTSRPHRPRERATLTGHTALVCGIAFTRDGRTLATASRDKSVRLWDTTLFDRPRLLTVLRAHTGETCGVSFSPDGRTLATAGGDGAVRLWSVGASLHPARPTVIRHGAPAYAVVFSPDGRTLATAGEDRTVRLWDLADMRRPREQARLTGHTGSVWSAAFSPDGRALATASSDGTVRLWAANGSRRHRPVTLVGHLRTVYAVAFSPDGRTLATAGEDQTVRLWDLADMRRPREQARLTGHIMMVISLSFSPDKRTLATTSQDHAVRLWDLPVPALTEHTDFVFAVAFSPDGRTLATTSQDRTARLWDVSDPRRRRALAVLTGHTSPVYGVAFSPDGRTLATTSEDRTARLWDVSRPGRPQFLAAPIGHRRNPEGVAFSPNSRVLATVSPDRTIRLWNITDRRKPKSLVTLTGHTDHIRSVAFSPDGRTLATAGDDRTARLWDITHPERPREHATLTSHKGGIRSTVFSPDGRTLATASQDHTIRLWNINDPTRPRVRATLSGHTSVVYDVAFSPDGRTLATAGDDRTARLWDITHPERPRGHATLTSHTDRLHHVAFSPDGHTIATTSRDGTTRLWETDVHRVTARICATAYPTITRQEWNKHFPGISYRPPCR
ncbi:hypothetical protein ACIP88_33705 [Streptomyces uncialis]|uniref:nSTAND1 domain-containing NTPase n=1 Tax=Streptomyces uncialis TaxID=1048205 RepID=UPI0037F95381